jgi:uncharacterized membrane protein
MRRKGIDKRSMRVIYGSIMIISIICLIFAVIIQVQKLDSASLDNICYTISPDSKCDVVQNSVYAKTFGIDNPFYGMAGFSVLAILSLLQLKRDDILRKATIMIGSIIAGIVAIWFLYVQKFILNAYCIFCVVVDVLSLILLGLAIYMVIDILNKKKRSRR